MLQVGTNNIRVLIRFLGRTSGPHLEWSVIVDGYRGQIIITCVFMFQTNDNSAGIFFLVWCGIEDFFPPLKADIVNLT